MRKAPGLIFCLFCVFILCGEAFAGNVNLSVAASLKEAINELCENYGRMNPAVRFIRNYGASGALAKQIENGAPSDIFISANSEWMEYLKNRKLVDASSIGTFAFNTLVFVGPAGKKVSGMHDLAKLDKIAIGSPKSVPAGDYAMEALSKAGIDRQLTKKLVMARDVRDCLMYAERGEVDGSFVYRTDALQGKRTKILFIVPQGLYPRVTYPLGLTMAGAGNGDARIFYRYLQSQEARSILIKYGFDVR